ncbi:hypothetical protein FRB99_002140, partial [Tulasnella sp. 403]
MSLCWAQCFLVIATASQPVTVEIQLPGATWKKKVKLEGGGYPVDVSGNFCDVYRGYEDSIGRVALKRYRVNSSTGIMDEHRRWLDEEAKHWAGLKHEHVLPFLGIAKDINKTLYLVSPWMDHGPLWEHISNDPLCDRPRYLWEISSALVYLHEKRLVHGDIQARNILISASNHAKLCDFNLSKPISMQTMAELKGVGSIRFQAPELWEGAGRTVKTDVYAFGMTIYQVLSGLLPFSDLQKHTTFINAVLKRNERPPCLPEVGPTGRSYRQLWVVAENCWQKDPADRHTMREVHLELPSFPSDLARRRSTSDNSSPAMTGSSPPTPSEHRVSPTPGLTIVQRLFHGVKSTLSTIRTPRTPSFQSQLISRLAAISESRNIVSDVADLGDIIGFDNPSSISLHTAAGNSDVYRAVLQRSRIEVAIKVLRPTNIGDTAQIDAVVKRLSRELRIWKALEHKRVIPLRGYAVLEIGACLISPWCDKGNASAYLKKYPSVDRHSLVLQVTEGLVYLHTHDPPIIHADIKADNVLINDDGEAMLCDFGLSKLLEDVPSGLTTTNGQKGTLRYMAPEQFGEKPLYTTETDVYAFGCLAIGVASAPA